MNLTAAEFADWKRHPVTQQVFSQIRQRIEYANEVLIGSAGIDQRSDAWHAGAISAFRDLLNIEYEGESPNGS